MPTNTQLKRERELRGWSQAKVAEQVGTETITISRWERGVSHPYPYFREKLCALFGRNAQELGLLPGNGSEQRSDTVKTQEEIAYPSRIYDPATPLPSPLSLLGRESLLQHIKRRLCASENASVTVLNGLPGVGKTALAVTLAHNEEIQDHFRDGTLWANLGPHPNILGTLSHWGSLLGVSPKEMTLLRDEKDWARVLRAAIGQRHFLIVIDDAWSPEDALSLMVCDLNCSYLVTTRFPTVGTAVTTNGLTEVQELTEEDGLALIARFSPEAVALSPTTMHDLIRSVGALPLALTLMGKYLRGESASNQPRRLRTAIQRLHDTQRRLSLSEPYASANPHTSLPPGTPRSLQAVIAVSDQHLTPQARLTLQALSVFPAKPNSFSEEAALAVCQEPTDVLDALSDTGLLESSGPERYTLHQTIADYARAYLQGEAAQRRMVSYLVAFVESHKTDYTSLEREMNNIFAALETAHELGLHAETVRGFNALAHFLRTRGFHEQEFHYVDYAYQAAMALRDPAEMVKMLLHKADLLAKQADYKQAEALLQEGVALARQARHDESLGLLLTSLGWVTLEQGSYQQAETYLQESLTLIRRSGRSNHLCAVLTTLGWVTLQQGHYQQATLYGEEALTLARQLGRAGRICLVLTLLGYLAYLQGNDARVIATSQEVLQLARPIGQREHVSIALQGLGLVAREQHDTAKAQEYFLEGMDLVRQIGHRERMVTLFRDLAITARYQGQYELALTYTQEGLELAHQIGSRWLVSSLLVEQGEIALQLQQPDVAAIHFADAQVHAPQGHTELQAMITYGLARLAALQQQIPQARSLGESSLALFTTMGHRRAKEVEDWLRTLPPRNQPTA